MVVLIVKTDRPPSVYMSNSSFVYVHICICMYVCVCMYVCMYVYVYMYVYTVADPEGGFRGFNPPPLPRLFCFFCVLVYENCHGPGP